MIPYVVEFKYDNGASIEELKTVVYTFCEENILFLVDKKYAKDADSMVTILSIREMKPNEVL